MPWQRDVAEIAGEIDPDTGLPAYREVVVTVPRQSGKTTLFLSFQIHRCTAPRWQQPQRSAFTAQSGKDARDKWLDELYPLIKSSRQVYRLVSQMTRGMGNEYIAWKNGSLIRLLSTSSSSGHSKTLQQAVLDEIWHDVDDRREQGLRPAMITVRDAQLLVCSTAGTAASVVYNRKVQLGRAAVEADDSRGMAYVEYSAPDDWDPEDEESYFGFMPALCPDPPCRCGVDDGGWRHTVTLDALRSERASMDSAEYARAYGNRATPASLSQPIDPVAFAACMITGRDRPDTMPVLFVDVSPMMRSSALGIAAADDSGLLVDQEHGPGTGWLIRRAAELDQQYKDADWFHDAGSAAGALVPAFAEIGIELKPFTGPDMGRASVNLQKLIPDKAIQIVEDQALKDALAGAVKLDVGDGLWKWGRRKSSTDIVSLVAITGAAWAWISREQQSFFGTWR